ncbi:hypothetical protein BU23DRAFT_119749 [Bimuria novae-zelandiae CBS 107.79]|uniref:Uncharacterized protein n=1 Tax=Bimuria novae-zelandiae CBS 107.79 TaxID=1447943 RepID=A0A6A5VGN2_9PLEO|nr:hypothetical protein BU23DRAFT_119749 [Bimuria novae-zelandiae CBS 107.79]
MLADSTTSWQPRCSVLTTPWCSCKTPANYFGRSRKSGSMRFFNKSSNHIARYGIGNLLCRCKHDFRWRFVRWIRMPCRMLIMEHHFGMIGSDRGRVREPQIPLFAKSEYIRPATALEVAEAFYNKGNECRLLVRPEDVNEYVCGDLFGVGFDPTGTVRSVSIVCRVDDYRQPKRTTNGQLYASTPQTSGIM